MSDRTSAAMPDPARGPQHDVQVMMRYDANKKSVGVAYLLWFFFGYFGGHRFYLQRTGSAVVMLLIFLISIPLTFVLIGYIGIAIVAIWYVVDAFLIPGITRDYNNRLISTLNA